MTFQSRTYKPTDDGFILSLVKRFSEFELPKWRRMDDIDSAKRTSLEKALQQPEPDSAIFIAEDADERGGLGCLSCVCTSRCDRIPAA